MVADESHDTHILRLPSRIHDDVIAVSPAFVDGKRDGIAERRCHEISDHLVVDIIVSGRILERDNTVLHKKERKNRIGPEFHTFDLPQRRVDMQISGLFVINLIQADGDLCTVSLPVKYPLPHFTGFHYIPHRSRISRCLHTVEHDRRRVRLTRSIIEEQKRRTAFCRHRIFPVAYMMAYKNHIVNIFQRILYFGLPGRAIRTSLSGKFLYKHFPRHDISYNMQRHGEIIVERIFIRFSGYRNYFKVTIQVPRFINRITRKMKQSYLARQYIIDRSIGFSYAITIIIRYTHGLENCAGVVADQSGQSKRLTKFHHMLVSPKKSHIISGITVSPDYELYAQRKSALGVIVGPYAVIESPAAVRMSVTFHLRLSCLYPDGKFIAHANVSLRIFHRRVKPYVAPTLVKRTGTESKDVISRETFADKYFHPFRSVISQTYPDSGYLSARIHSEFIGRQTYSHCSATGNRAQDIPSVAIPERDIVSPCGNQKGQQHKKRQYLFFHIRFLDYKSLFKIILFNRGGLM